MRVLVTGADGFVGGWLVRRLIAEGHEVHGAVRAGVPPSPLLSAQERQSVRWLSFDLVDAGSMALLAEAGPEAVIHLAAQASGREARQDPGLAWNLNAAGTARLLEAIATVRRERGTDPLVIIASTGEVYGDAEPGLRLETDPLAPCSPYASSKVGAETAALEVGRRTGLRVTIARPFAHTGPGQAQAFVVPAFVSRIRLAGRAKAPVVKTGNLEPVRDFLDVRDVVSAYLALLHRGTAGEVYNIASGQGIALAQLFDQLAALLKVRVIPEPDPDLMRGADIRYLVGDAAKLRRATGWSPVISFEQTLRDMVDAQAD